MRPLGLEPKTCGLKVPSDEVASDFSDNDFADSPQTACTNSGHLLASAVEFDPDFPHVRAAWPTLPEPIRRAILAIIASQESPAAGSELSDSLSACSQCVNESDGTTCN
jgi:hypothetical protein